MNRGLSRPPGRGIRAAACLPAVLTALTGLGTACSRRAPGTPVMAGSEADGYRFEVPARWLNYGEETRSLDGSVFAVEIVSLVDGDPKFLAALPDAILPQLEGRTRYYFNIVRPLVKRPATVDGRPALEVTFPVRVRESDLDQEVRYWILREEDSLFLLRATISAAAIESDRKDADAMIASFRFTRPQPAASPITFGAQPAPGS